jgi:hypothetical protein
MSDSTATRPNATAPGYRNYVYQLIVLVVAAAIAYKGAVLLHQALFKGKAQGTEISDPRLVISEEELDLGRVYESSAYEHAFRITNAADQPVTIVRFETTCDCLGITPGAGVTLQPQETKTFTIKLSLASRVANTDSWGGEPYEVRFGAVYTGDGQGPYATAWRLRCVLVPTIRLRPSTLQLGTQSERQPRIEQSVDIEATDEIRRIDAEAPSSWAVEIVRDQANLSPNRFQAVVRSQGKLTPRQVSDVIRLHPVGRDDNRLPGKELKLVGEIVRDVAAFPGEIHHGRQACGTAAEEAIRLRSLTDRPFRVKRVTARDSDLEVTHVEGKGQNGVYSLRLRFTKPGDQRAVAEFIIQDEDGTEYGLAVPVRYHGLAGP